LSVQSAVFSKVFVRVLGFFYKEEK
jgi:hypothetical protein